MAISIIPLLSWKLPKDSGKTVSTIYICLVVRSWYLEGSYRQKSITTEMTMQLIYLISNYTREWEYLQYVGPTPSCQMLTMFWCMIWNIWSPPQRQISENSPAIPAVLPTFNWEMETSTSSSDWGGHSLFPILFVAPLRALDSTWLCLFWSFEKWCLQLLEMSVAVASCSLSFL